MSTRLIKRALLIPIRGVFDGVQPDFILFLSGGRALPGDRHRCTSDVETARGLRSAGAVGAPDRRRRRRRGVVRGGPGVADHGGDAEGCAAPSTSFWGHFSRVSHAFLCTPPRMRRGICSAKCPCVSGADWCSLSDVAPDSELQASLEWTAVTRAASATEDSAKQKGKEQCNAHAGAGGEGGRVVFGVQGQGVRIRRGSVCGVGGVTIEGACGERVEGCPENRHMGVRQK